MRRAARGGPGQFAERRERAERLAETVSGAARAPLEVQVAVLEHQLRRSAAVDPARPNGDGHLPLLDLDGAATTVIGEVATAIDALAGIGGEPLGEPTPCDSAFVSTAEQAKREMDVASGQTYPRKSLVPEPLAESGAMLRSLGPSELAAVVETWLDDTSLVEPRLAFWIRVAASPVLEAGAAAATAPTGWTGAACPLCGGSAQASVIAEESGEFMAGSPRSLVCGRCATWWSFPRVTCVACGDDDSTHIDSFLVDDQRWVRVDCCSSCRSYVKTFDLREKGSLGVVPLVDDVATSMLDVWAQHRGYSRPSLSFAGV